MPAQPIDWEVEGSKLVARAWADEAFKQRLVADPAAVLEEHGLIVPAGVTLKVLENSDKVINLVIPVKPAPAELSEEDLHRVAGGYCSRCHERCYERCRC